MNYKCLVFDHDDTTVNSTTNVHYPSFLAYMQKTGRTLNISLDDYVRYNFNPGVIGFFRDICGLTEQEMSEEQDFWFEYTHHHVSKAFDGIREIMEQQKREGGHIAVVSHSFSDNILRDYEYNHLPQPDMVFGWEQPREQRKPAPFPLYAIMEKFSLKPEELLVIDDLKPGLDMAKSAGVPFAAAGWCFSIAENEAHMRQNADFYCTSVEELAKVCFG